MESLGLALADVGDDLEGQVLRLEAERCCGNDADPYECAWGSAGALDALWNDLPAHAAPHASAYALSDPLEDTTALMFESTADACPSHCVSDTELDELTRASRRALITAAKHNQTSVRRYGTPVQPGAWQGCSQSPWCNARDTHPGACNAAATIPGVRAYATTLEYSNEVDDKGTILDCDEAEPTLPGGQADSSAAGSGKHGSSSTYHHPASHPASPHDEVVEESRRQSHSTYTHSHRHHHTDGGVGVAAVTASELELSGQEGADGLGRLVHARLSTASGEEVDGADAAAVADDYDEPAVWLRSRSSGPCAIDTDLLSVPTEAPRDVHSEPPTPLQPQQQQQQPPPQQQQQQSRMVLVSNINASIGTPFAQPMSLGRHHSMPVAGATGSHHHHHHHHGQQHSGSASPSLPLQHAASYMVPAGSGVESLQQAGSGLWGGDVGAAEEDDAGVGMSMGAGGMNWSPSAAHNARAQQQQQQLRGRQLRARQQQPRRRRRPQNQQRSTAAVATLSGASPSQSMGYEGTGEGEEDEEDADAEVAPAVQQQQQQGRGRQRANAGAAGASVAAVASRRTLRATRSMPNFRSMALGGGVASHHHRQASQRSSQQHTHTPSLARTSRVADPTTTTTAAPGSTAAAARSKQQPQPASHPEVPGSVGGGLTVVAAVPAVSTPGACLSSAGSVMDLGSPLSSCPSSTLTTLPQRLLSSDTVEAGAAAVGVGAGTHLHHVQPAPAQPLHHLPPSQQQHHLVVVEGGLTAAATVAASGVGTRRASGAAALQQQQQQQQPRHQHNLRGRGAPLLQPNSAAGARARDDNDDWDSTDGGSEGGEPGGVSGGMVGVQGPMVGANGLRASRLPEVPPPQTLGGKKRGASGGPGSTCARPVPHPNGHVCTACGTSVTPVWRAGPQGPKTLCNACGVRYMKVAKRK